MIKFPRFISRQFLFSAVLGICLLGSATPLYASAMTYLEKAVQKAVDILRDPALSVPEKRLERREKLRKVLYAEFDFVAMSRGAVGRPWRKFSKEQKKRFIPLFRHLLENTYMDTIERYKGEDVRFIKEVEQSKNVVRVDSIVRSKGAEFKVSYQMRRRDQAWKVFNVIIEGVSVVSNYRAQFRQILRRGTSEEIEKLLTRLKNAADTGKK